MFSRQPNDGLGYTNPSNKPGDTLNQFFGSQAFNDLVVQSDNDQREMIRQAERIEKSRHQAQTKSQPATQTRTPKVRPKK